MTRHPQAPAEVTDLRPISLEDAATDAREREHRLNVERLERITGLLGDDVDPDTRAELEHERRHLRRLELERRHPEDLLP